MYVGHRALGERGEEATMYIGGSLLAIILIVIILIFIF